jgi:hypothetical protein
MIFLFVRGPVVNQQLTFANPIHPERAALGSGTGFQPVIRPFFNRLDFTRFPAVIPHRTAVENPKHIDNR